MHFSIYMNPQTRGPEEDVGLIEDNVRQVVRVTDAGFAGVVLTEHHFSEYNTYADNVYVAGFLAGRCRPGTKFLLSAVLPPLHNPMRLAEQLALLDIFTRGNAIIGLGAGGAPAENAGLGREPKDRYEDYEQVLEIVRAVTAKKWSDPPYEWKTRYESGTVFGRLMPTGYHRPLPPFAKAAIADEAAEKAGADGLYLFTGRMTLAETVRRLEVYRAGLDRSGLSDEEVDERLEWSFIQKNVIIADTDEQAREESFERIRSLNEFHRRTVAAFADRVPKKEAILPPIVTPGKNQDEAFYERSFVAGTPETVRAELQRYADAGVRHMAIYFNFGHMPTEDADRSIGLFLDHVFPHLADEVLQPTA